METGTVKKRHISYLILGLLSVTLGIYALFHPLFTWATVTVLFIAFTFIFGFSRMNDYIASKAKGKGNGFLLFQSIVALIFSIVLMFNFLYAAVLVPIFFGIWLLFAGVTELVLGFSNLKGYSWIILVISGLLFAILGFFMIFNTVFGVEVLIIYFAIQLIITGIIYVIGFFAKAEIPGNRFIEPISTDDIE